MDYKENIFADEGYNTGNENTKQAEKKYGEKWDEHKKSVRSSNEELTIMPPERNNNKKKQSGLNLVYSEILDHILKASTPHLHYRGFPKFVSLAS